MDDGRETTAAGVVRAWAGAWMARDGARVAALYAGGGAYEDVPTGFVNTGRVARASSRTSRP